MILPRFFPQLPQPLFSRQPSTISTSTATMADPVTILAIVEALASTASFCCHIIRRVVDAPKEIWDLNGEASNWRPQLEVSWSPVRVVCKLMWSLLTPIKGPCRALGE